MNFFWGDNFDTPKKEISAWKQATIEAVGQPYVAKFIDFIGSEEGQSLMSSYGTKEHGEGLYIDAAYAKQYNQ